MSKIINFTEFAGLDPVRIGAIIGYLVQYNRIVDKVKEAYKRDYTSDISTEVIQRIFAKYKDIYAEKRKEFIEHTENRHVYHLAYRLVEWESLYEIAMSEENILEVIKVDRDTQDVEKGKDIPLAKAILHDAAWDVHQHRKIQAEIDKNKAGKEEYQDEESDIGFSRAG